MSIDKAIKQTRFSSVYHRTSVNLLYTYHWLASLQAEALKPLDITIQQFNILRILRGQHPKAATVTFLIDRMIDKNSNASRIVERLRQKELVVRHVCPADRRRVDVSITPQGLELVEQASHLIKGQELFLESLSTDEAETLNALLDKIRSNHNSNKPSTNK